jgi:biofilm PGA synthesis N-glycosyltransferase PgaC
LLPLEYFLYDSKPFTTIGETRRIFHKLRFGRAMNNKPKKLVEKLPYLVLIIPLLLTYFSWRWFPTIAEQFATKFYQPKIQPTHWLWYATTRFYYTWFTFITIGGAGTLATAAWLSRRRHKPVKLKEYPMISFIIPAHNEERNIAQCINSIYKCISEYNGSAEIIIIDDGSTDQTYEIAWATIEHNKRTQPNIRAKVIRHTANLGKIEAIKTGLNKSLGNITAIVDADSQWKPNTLKELLAYMQKEDKAAVTGYIHPTNNEKGKQKENTYIKLQQLEYSQGLAIFRNAQDLGNAVFIIPGPIGLYDTEKLRKVTENTKSVTEDLEIALEMQKKGFRIGYTEKAVSTTIAPSSLNNLWNQRLRWFIGWMHNTLDIHKELLYKNKWISLLIWYCLLTEYIGAVIEITAIATFPVLFWYAPDRILFILNLILFLLYALFIGTIIQAIALKFAYNKFNYQWLLLYTPIYTILRLINAIARLKSLQTYLKGNKGNWHKQQNSIITIKKQR